VKRCRPALLRGKETLVGEDGLLGHRPAKSANETSPYKPSRRRNEKMKRKRPKKEGHVDRSLLSGFFFFRRSSASLKAFPRKGKAKLPNLGRRNEKRLKHLHGQSSISQLKATPEVKCLPCRERVKALRVVDSAAQIKIGTSGRFRCQFLIILICGPCFVWRHRA